MGDGSSQELPGAVVSCGDDVRALVADHGGQVMGALTGVAIPAVTVAVAMPGWQPGRLAVTV